MSFSSSFPAIKAHSCWEVPWGVLKSFFGIEVLYSQLYAVHTVATGQFCVILGVLNIWGYITLRQITNTPEMTLWVSQFVSLPGQSISGTVLTIVCYGWCPVSSYPRLNGIWARWVWVGTAVSLVPTPGDSCTWTCEPSILGSSFSLCKPRVALSMTMEVLHRRRCQGCIFRQIRRILASFCH